MVPCSGYSLGALEVCADGPVIWIHLHRLEVLVNTLLELVFFHITMTTCSSEGWGQAGSLKTHKLMAEAASQTFKSRCPICMVERHLHGLSIIIRLITFGPHHPADNITPVKQDPLIPPPPPT